MGTSSVGARRVARYLARNYTDEYTAVGHEFNLGLVGIMGPVEAVDMWRDARIFNSQARILLKHLRYHFKSPITVPFEKMYSLVDGYTKPKVKVFEYHKEGEKIPEVVHAQYQDISVELTFKQNH